MLACTLQLTQRRRHFKIFGPEDINMGSLYDMSLYVRYLLFVFDDNDVETLSLSLTGQRIKIVRIIAKIK